MASSDAKAGGSRPRVCVLAAHHLKQSGLWLGGGAEKYLLASVAGLLNAGADVHIGYCGDDIYGELRGAWPEDRLTLEQLPWLNERLSGDRRVTRSLVRERRQWFVRQQADAAFFVQQAHGTAFGASVIAARMAGMRVVMSVRQPPATFPKRTGKKYLGVVPSLEIWRRQLRWRSQRVARSCHAIVFNCEAVHRAFVEHWGWPDARCVVIRNGVEWRTPVRERASGVVTFGCVGQVAEHKGADIVVEAARRLAAGGEVFEVAFFGDGGLAEPLKAASRDLPVRFHSFIREVDRVFSQIDVLVAASRRESSSNAVLEAMARGIPCIVSDAGGLPELVRFGESGLVVPAGDATALAEAMRRIGRDRELRRVIALAGLKTARTDHGAETQSAETVELILGRKRQRLVRSSSTVQAAIR